MSKHSALNVLEDQSYYTGLAPLATHSTLVSPEDPLFDPRLESSLLDHLLEFYLLNPLSTGVFLN